MTSCLVHAGWEIFEELDTISLDDLDELEDGAKYTDIFRTYIDLVQKYLPPARLFWHYAYLDWLKMPQAHAGSIFDYEKMEIMACWVEAALKTCSDSDSIDKLVCQAIAKFLAQLVINFKSYEFPEKVSQLFAAGVLAQHSGCTNMEARVILNFASVIYDKFYDVNRFPDNVLLVDADMMDTSNIGMDEMHAVGRVISDDVLTKVARRTLPSWAVRMAFMMAVRLRSDRIDKELDYRDVVDEASLVEFMRRPIIRYALLGLACGRHLI